MISIQTLYDALLAFAVVVGIAATYTLAMVAAGALYRRRELHAVLPPTPGSPAQPTPTDDARVLVHR